MTEREFETLDRLIESRAKGFGEPGCVPTAPAIANAIYDAVGVRIRDLPITPEKVQLFGLTGTPVKGTVAIVPEKNYPFKIVKTRAQSGRNIRYELKEEKNPGKLSYVLTIENLKQDEGRYYDKIELETDSQLKPKISIPVYGRITEPKRTN